MTKWSDQQNKIFTWFESGKGNLVVRARAGTGKTTTITEAVSRASCRNALLCSFNKEIATELEKRLTQPKRGKSQAKTLHQVGISFVYGAWGKVDVDPDRGRRIAQKVCKGASREEILTVQKLVSWAKLTLLPGCSDKDLSDLAVDKIEGVDLSNLKNIIEWTKEALALTCVKDKSIDYDDMIYLPLALNILKPRYDLVVVDECQDMNAAQIEMARRICFPDGRIVVVGDDKQAVYGFRGADSGSIDRLLNELDAEEMPLTVTYRCGRKIVESAQEYVSDFYAADTVGEGAVFLGSLTDMTTYVKSGDFILSRTNAPLASIALELLSQGRRVKIRGVDIKQTLLKIINEASKEITTLEEMVPVLNKYRNNKKVRVNSYQDLSQKQRDRMIHTINDEYDCVLNLCQGLIFVSELISRINSLFDEVKKHQKDGFITCSTVHRAKGLEADSVFVLQNTFKFEGPEEDNLKYVAITRAKSRLIWVS